MSQARPDLLASADWETIVKQGTQKTIRPTRRLVIGGVMTGALLTPTLAHAQEDVSFQHRTVFGQRTISANTLNGTGEVKYSLNNNIPDILLGESERLGKATSIITDIFIDRASNLATRMEAVYIGREERPFFVAMTAGTYQSPFNEDIGVLDGMTFEEFKEMQTLSLTWNKGKLNEILPYDTQGLILPYHFWFEKYTAQ